MGKQVDQPPTEAYEAPELRVLGSVEELTLATDVGPDLDATFTVGTALIDVLVS
jgi:hypothetical protein